MEAERDGAITLITPQNNRTSMLPEVWGIEMFPMSSISSSGAVTTFDLVARGRNPPETTLLIHHNNLSIHHNDLANNPKGRPMSTVRDIEGPADHAIETMVPKVPQASPLHNETTHDNNDKQFETVNNTVKMRDAGNTVEINSITSRLEVSNFEENKLATGDHQANGEMLPPEIITFTTEDSEPPADREITQTEILELGGQLIFVLGDSKEGQSNMCSSEEVSISSCGNGAVVVENNAEALGIDGSISKTSQKPIYSNSTVGLTREGACTKTGFIKETHHCSSIESNLKTSNEDLLLSPLKEQCLMADMKTQRKDEEEVKESPNKMKRQYCVLETKQIRSPKNKCSLSQIHSPTARTTTKRKGNSYGQVRECDNHRSAKTKSTTGTYVSHPSEERMSFSGYDLKTLKETASKLNLETRRPSFLAWKSKYLQQPTVTDIAIDEQRDRQTSDTTSEDGRIAKVLESLRNDLAEMKQTDHELARQLLLLRKDIHRFKLKVTCTEHEELLREVKENMEEIHELSDLCDFPFDTLHPLQRVGVTRMNFSTRRFSTS